MEPQPSTQSHSSQISEFGERIARMETKMDYVATHKDLAALGVKVHDGLDLEPIRHHHWP